MQVMWYNRVMSNITKKTFKQIMKTLQNDESGLLDVSKIASLPDETKDKLAYYIVRNRGPVVEDFISKGFDMDWLYSMGYLYKTKGKFFSFLHTSEHRIVV